MPKEYRLDGHAGGDRALWDAGRRLAEGRRAPSIVEISLPHTRYALPAYYIVAPAEASSNLARYDGVRYGLREPGKDIIELYENTRATGFGEEVRRRIMIGTYVLSAGYYDAYYVRAQKIRTPDQARLRNGLRRWSRCGADAGDAVARLRASAKRARADPVEMYLNDVFTVTVNMAGLPGIAVPAGLSGKACRSPCN